jgi:1-acylglycerone phosphate reductase
MPLTDVTLPKVRSLFETNVFSVMAMTNAMLPFLLASQGLVINISSASDRMPFPFKGTYAMTKAALSSYSRTLSVELAEYNVRVLNVVTAFVSSQLGKRAEPDPWPEDSLFDSMRGTGQKAGSHQRMSAEAYAKQVVTEALRGKGYEMGPLRFFGTQESMMLGSMSTSMWILSFLGENWARFAMLRMWPFWMLRDALVGKKKNA